MIRKPCVAGMFYPLNKEELLKQLTRLFKQVKKTKVKKVFGIISPHAGYVYSGKASASAFSCLPDADTYIIIATSHQGRDSVSFEDFETPLGIVKNDIEFSKKIDIFPNNESVHVNEHAIEVQLPFLQFKKKDKIVPITVSSINNLKEKAKMIVNISKKLKRKICVIVSSDFTHFGPMYGFMPFPPDKKQLYALDMRAIKAIEKLDSETFLQIANKTTICGTAAIALGIELVKQLGSSKARLLEYYTSGDIVRDYRNAVGYAAMAFE